MIGAIARGKYFKRHLDVTICPGGLTAHPRRPLAPSGVPVCYVHFNTNVNIIYLPTIG